MSSALALVVCWSGCQQNAAVLNAAYFTRPLLVIYSAHAFKSNVGIYHSGQIVGELSFNISSLPQLPYLSKGLGS